MSRLAPALLVAGDRRHGVALYARQLAGAVQALAPGVRVVADPGATSSLHVHFTDRLWGSTPERAAAALVALADGRRLTATLHDLPQPSDGPVLPRRRAAYRRVAEACDRVVVSSEHERTLLRETAAATKAVTVIPLPVIAPDGAVAPSPDTRPRPDVALLGYVYPGKGHAEAIAAIAQLPRPRPMLRVLGAVSRGHDAELASLRAQASRSGVTLSVSGWLEDEALLGEARAARVPLAAHAHVSASGSVNYWIAAERRPLVADSAYAREIDGLRPGTIRRYRPSELTGAIAAALREPGLTRLGAHARTRPHLPDIAAAHLDWWRRA